MFDERMRRVWVLIARTVFSGIHHNGLGRILSCTYKTEVIRRVVVNLWVVRRSQGYHLRLVRCDRHFLLEDEFAVVGKVIESQQVQKDFGY